MQLTRKEQIAAAYMAAYVNAQLIQQSSALGDHDPMKAIASRAFDMADAFMEESHRRESASAPATLTDETMAYTLATIKTKRIKRGFYRVVREDGEVFEIHKVCRPSSRNNTWITERQSDYKPFGDPTLGRAKLSIELKYY